jgi:outer membrane murein-binding lipoprotein Lpp
VVHSEIDTTETTRAQLGALYAGLAQDEKRILDELATASSTATAEIARIQAEFDAVRAEKAAKLDAINAVRASF